MTNTLSRGTVAVLNRPAVSVELWRFGLMFALFACTSAFGAWLSIPGLPLFYVDLVLLAPFLTRWPARLLISISLVTAVLRVVQHILGFDQLFVSSYLLLHNLTGFPGAFVVLVFGLAIASLLLFYWLMSHLPARPVSISVPVILLAVVAIFGVKQYEDKIKLNLIGTSYGYLIGSFKFASMFNGHYRLPYPQGEHSPGRMGAALALTAGTNYLLIAVESLGVLRNDGLQRSMVSALDDPRLREKYEITSGQTPAKGSTIHGEIRELCGGLLTKGLFANGNTHCLPSEFRRQGYQTLAIHANHARIYGRDIWYPKIGFERYVNADAGGMPHAEWFDRWGTLLDRDSIAWATDELAANDGVKKFVYLLTVSTHLPATLLPDATLDSQCAATKSVCVHHANLRSVIEAIAQSAQKLSNTTIVLVGDHPPPFVSPSSRNAFSSDAVPYVILAPRRQGPTATQRQSLL